MKTTVKHVGSAIGRKWEGPEDASIAHRAVIEHWCDGGEVEIKTCVDEVWYSCDPQFAHNREYRIKQRKAKAGEVWVCKKSLPYVYNYDLKEFVNIWSNQNLESVMKTLSYAAPSVEAYYARKFLNESKVDLSSNARIGDLLRAVHKAAQLDH